jgi:hypothetical protein
VSEINEGKSVAGPWFYRPLEHDDWGTIRSSEGELVAVAKDSSISFSELDSYRTKKVDPYEAHARLISAAPDMLKALEAQELLASLRMPGDVQRNIVKVRDLRRAAIAKATGKQP